MVALSQDLVSRIQALINTGQFASEEEVLRRAVSALEYELRDVESIHRGLADIEAGRVQPAEEVEAEIRAEFSFGKP